MNKNNLLHWPSIRGNRSTHCVRLQEEEEEDENDDNNEDIDQMIINTKEKKNEAMT